MARMAKPKKTNEETKTKEKTKAISITELNDIIKKKYGNVVKEGSEVLKSINNLKVLSVSPTVDLITGGGIREGTVVILTSDPKAGKTTTALHFAAKHQDEYNIVYVNTENRLSKQNFEGIKNLNPERIHVIESGEKILSAEDYLNIIEMYTQTLPNTIIIVDSTSNMVPKDELEGEIKTGIRNSLPRLLSHFCKRIAPYLVRNKIIMILVTHNIANTSGNMRGPLKHSDCGNQIKYQAGANLSITHTIKWAAGGKKEDDDNSNDPQIGQRLNWKLTTSNCGGTPGSIGEGWLRYGIGIDEVQETFQIALQLSIIKASGSWFYIGEKAIQGGEKVVTFLNENPDVLKSIQQEIKELINV
jgi:recombination protein RecA